MNETMIKAIAYDTIAKIIECGPFNERLLGAICGIIKMTDSTVESIENKRIADELLASVPPQITEKKPEPLPSEEEQEAIEEEIKELMEEKPNSTPKKPRAPKVDFTGAHKMPKDLNKLRACIEAGKDIKWCMAEWSVCEQTIRNWMAEAGIKKKDGRRKDK